MYRFQTYQVLPAIPEPLSFLEILGRNIWWCWQKDAIELFRRINPRLWRESRRNPLAFLTLVPQERLEELAKDQSFLAHQQRVKQRFEKRVLLPLDRSKGPYGIENVIGYFSMEFGIHESLPLYAGGLGMLAGDHLKAASNLTLPLLGMGLLYRKAYFTQILDHEGWQQEQYPETDIYHLPIEKVADDTGNDLTISIPGPIGDIKAVVWKLDVGRIPLYLLDTNLPENPAEIREITSRLYAGEHSVRLAQEVVLGIGGMQAFEAMGKYPQVCHLNEGHAAFAVIERLAQIITTYSVDLKTAFEIVPRTTVFTTHTPVAAGHDEFPVDLVKPYLMKYEKIFGVDINEIISWGQPSGSGHYAPLSMVVLALRLSQYCNGVSELHGKVARRMWTHLWPQRPEDEIPISHVTNGVHLPSYISLELAQLFEQYIGPEWYLQLRNEENAKHIDEIYDEELWRAHEMCRLRLVRNCREMMIQQYGRRNAPLAIMEDISSVLDPDTLTIAFARRFATYKRAHLLFHNPARLEAILSNEKYPVQLIFSGKAHPRDNEGKAIIKRINDFARNSALRHRIIFLENYDPHIARHLVQGADVWLNTPRRPLEACGTSGMKAAINGVLNVSTLDGWWCEGYSETLGWKIGNAEEYSDHGYQDALESLALYNILENDVIPCFYNRNNGGVSLKWLKMMKESMKMAFKQFNSHRMLREYEHKFYYPASKNYRNLLENNAEKAKQMVLQRDRLKKLWSGIKISHPISHSSGPFRVGQMIPATVIVSIGELQPNEVDVELYNGQQKSLDSISAGENLKMTVQENLGNGEYLYSGTIICNASGRYGFTARVVPHGDEWIKQTPELLTWSD
jgi:glycogen phosphorylase